MSTVSLAGATAKSAAMLRPSSLSRGVSETTPLCVTPLPWRQAAFAITVFSAGLWVAIAATATAWL